MARRPWPAPWSSTTVPVSAIPTAAPVTTASIASSSAEVSPSSTTARGTSRSRPCRHDDAASPRRGPPPRRPEVGGGAPRHLGPVVGHPLGEEVEHVARSASSAERSGVVGCRAAAARSGAVTGARAGRPGRGRGERRHARRPAPRRGRSRRALVAADAAATRRGTTRAAAGAGRGPGSTASPGQGSQDSARRPPGIPRPATEPTGEPGEPLPAGPCARHPPCPRRRPSSPAPRPWARRRRGARRRPWRAGAPGCRGCRCATGHTSPQAPHSVEA